MLQINNLSRRKLLFHFVTLQVFESWESEKEREREMRGRKKERENSLPFSYRRLFELIELIYWPFLYFTSPSFFFSLCLFFFLSLLTHCLVFHLLSMKFHERIFLLPSPSRLEERERERTKRQRERREEREEELVNESPQWVNQESLRNSVQEFGTKGDGKVFFSFVSRLSRARKNAFYAYFWIILSYPLKFWILDSFDSSLYERFQMERK